MPTMLRNSRPSGRQLVPEDGALILLCEIDDDIALPYTEKKD